MSLKNSLGTEYDSWYSQNDKIVEYIVSADNCNGFLSIECQTRVTVDLRILTK